MDFLGGVLSYADIVFDARFIGIAGVVIDAIEKIKNIHADIPVLIESIVALQIHERGRPELEAIIFFEWMRAEIADRYRTEPIVEIVDRGRCGDNTLNGSGKSISGGIVVSESRFVRSEFKVEE